LASSFASDFGIFVDPPALGKTSMLQKPEFFATLAPHF
jgi:hypothetical protein